MGQTVLGAFDPFSIVLAILAVRLLVTVSFPCSWGTLAGAVLSQFSHGGFPPARGEGDSTTSTVPTETPLR